MSESKLIYYTISHSKLIPFATAVSKNAPKHKISLDPLRLTNVGNEVASVSFGNSYNGGATTLKYRRDEEQAFVDWDLSVITIAPGEYVEFVGENYNTQGFLGKYTITGDAVAASGNIMSLIYGAYTTRNALVIPEGIMFSDGSYYGMFSDCSLVSAPSMPATTLTEWCYAAMFSGCAGLSEPPVLPATVTKTRCYYKMFEGCASLTTAPALPATELADYCYSSMFSGCTGLTTAPELSATTLAEWCYAYMFYGCTSLTTAPALPATELADYCYAYMFENCGIGSAPELPAMTLEPYCYASMFYDCNSLTTAPELPATTLAEYCYSGMFVNCTNLTTAPELPATELVDGCYESMFNNCTSLTSLIVGFSEWLDGTTDSWLERVSLNGTFTCPPNLDTTQRGADYIPEGWTIVTV